MLYEAEKGDISILVAGDAMITKRMSPFREPSFLKLVEVIRGADLSVVNAEMLFHNFEMSWQGKDSISYQVSDPANLKELKWMGFDVVTTANNHAFDYSEEGLLATLRNMKEHEHTPGRRRRRPGPRPCPLLHGHGPRTGCRDVCNNNVFRAVSGTARPSRLCGQAGNQRRTAQRDASREARTLQRAG